MVAHHLAKVRVASSNLVIRSSEVSRSETERPVRTHYGGVAERRGSGLQSRPHGFKSRRHLHSRQKQYSSQEERRAIGAAVARFPDTEEVTGSIPVSPTEKDPRETGGFLLSPGLREGCVVPAWYSSSKWSGQIVPQAVNRGRAGTVQRPRAPHRALCFRR